MRFSGLVAGTWLLSIVCTSIAPAADRLPPESVLPGQVTLPPDLPPESVLPEGFVAASAAPPAAARLPGEDQLPPAAAQPPAPDALQAADDDVAKLDDSPDRLPWLRLDLAGHAAAIRSLVFTPDSHRLCTAGDDKSAIVWRRVDRPGAAQDPWVYERTVRWQIQRGPRGRVYTLAAGNGLLALAGDGAMDEAKAVLVDPATGQWKAALVDQRVGTHPIVVSLSVSPDPQQPGVVSNQMDGQAMYWSPERETGLWKARQIQPPDREAYGEVEAARLLSWRRFCPVVMTSGRTAVLPVFAGRDTRGNVRWRLTSIDVESGAKRSLGGEGVDSLHTRMVLALTASSDSKHLVSTDDAGRIFLWDLQAGSLLHRMQETAAVLSLAFDRAGQRLLLGGYRRDAGGADLQLWNVRDPQNPALLWSRKVDDHVLACAISPDGRDIAYAQGTSAVIQTLADRERKTVLRAPVRSPMRVAFAREAPLYRIAFGYEADTLTETFDATTVQLGRQPQVDAKDWVANTWWQGDWSVVTVPAAEAGPDREETYWLAKAGRRVARLPLRASVHGAPTATCWIPDRQGRPLAAVIGTDGQNNIYVFRLSDQGDCGLLRMFRGHEAAVTSVGVSRDLRYLVSAARDMTIRLWPVGDVVAADELISRWGAEFAVEDGRLKVTRLREDGPLFFRGVRVGDTIARLMWREQDRRISTDQPAEMLTALRQRPWQERLVFEYLRAGNLSGAFQVFPAWQQLVSLVVAENREWAFWTPSGFYDASFEGHRLFGWQVNRGLDRAPDFFLAAQLRKRLERPDIMSRLLNAGSIEQAFRAARQEPPFNSQLAVQREYLAKPEVAILLPHPGTPIEGDRAIIEAAISVPLGEQLIPPKAFANGVVAGEPERIERVEMPDGQRLTFRWTARLPSDPQIQFQVVAATEAEVVDTAEVIVPRATVPAAPAARLFIAAAGVNQYRDAQLPRLDFAVRNAVEFTDTLRSGARPFYDSQAVSLLDQDVNRSLWSVTMQQYAADLARQVTPDDLLVIFLSGHGVRDPDAGDYYFVTADARYGDLLGRRYADCLDFEDFAAFARIPCRKLVVLDTCHSGAVQPLRQQQLKAALRTLQDDLVFTLTASEGSQEAVESRERRLGRFTARLIEALQGSADQQTGNRDGIVTLDEAAEYVKRTVTADSATDPNRQYPTAGPSALIPLTRLPLTQAATESEAGEN